MPAVQPNKRLDSRLPLYHSPMSWLAIIVALILNGSALVICGGICAAIAQKKNLNVRKSFTRGALLGVIGIISVLKQKPGLPKAPPGTEKDAA